MECLTQEWVSECGASERERREAALLAELVQHQAVKDARKDVFRVISIQLVFLFQIYTLYKPCLPKRLAYMYLVENHCLSQITKFESCSLFSC